MSNLILPTPTPQTGWNWKLPLKASPSYTTLRQTPANNRGELRISLTQYPTWDFELDIPYIFGQPNAFGSGFQQLIGFYGQMQGGADDWLFDWPGNDTITTPQVVGVGDGINNSFLFLHTIGGMTELLQDFNGSPTVYVGGSPTTYSRDSFGNFIPDVLPTVGQQVAWKGSWYYRCCFLDDKLQDLRQIRNGLWDLKSLKFKSLLL